MNALGIDQRSATLNVQVSLREIELNMELSLLPNQPSSFLLSHAPPFPNCFICLYFGDGDSSRFPAKFRDNPGQLKIQHRYLSCRIITS